MNKNILFVISITLLMLILTSCNLIETKKETTDIQLIMDLDKSEYDQKDEIILLVSLNYTGNDDGKIIYLEEDSFHTVFIHENGQKLEIEKPYTSSVGMINLTKEKPITNDYSMYGNYDRIFITGFFKRYETNVSSLKISPEKNLKLYPGKYTIITTLKGFYDEAKTDSFIMEVKKEIEVIRSIDDILIHFTTEDNTIEALIYIDKNEYYSKESKHGFMQLKNISKDIIISDNENIVQTFLIDSMGNKKELIEADSHGKMDLTIEPSKYYWEALPLPYRYDVGVYTYQIVINNKYEIVFDLTILDE